MDIGLMLIKLGIAALMFIAGLLLLTVARRGRDGRLKRNQLMGIRTKFTLASDEAWAIAHRAGARPTEIGAAGYLVAAVVLPFVPMDVAVSAVVIASTVWCLSWALAGATIGQRAAYDELLPNGESPESRA